ncbi:hypothetical protein SDC9_07992 [bioreactor metagenome]|uniref:Chloroplast import component protein (Tic20) n=1 Tax=bioreactor metagenome TaxID=1076179 RepID=A0A644T863_9ZZZZ|nr:hypothetical protein [Candidatus Elulimicrobiales bacterium]
MEKDNKEKKVEESAENNNIFYAFAYILFFLPLLALPDSKVGKYHANQGLGLLIFAFIGYTVLGILPIFGWLLMPAFKILLFILIVIGFLNGWDERQRPLPLIGKWFKLIK